MGMPESLHENSLQKMEGQEFTLLDRQKLFRIIQAMVDAVLVFTPEGSIQLYNPAFQKIFGFSRKALAGQSLYPLFQPIMPELPDILIELILSGEPSSQEIALDSHPQGKVFLLYITPIVENGVVTEGVAVFHDITQVRQTEKMRRDFVANVSHELRTPLSAINGYAETLLDGALQDENVARDFVRIIFNHTQRLSHLVSDLLDLSKLESSESPPELCPMDITAIIEKVVQLNQKLLREKGIELQYKPPESLPHVLAHASSIEQVLTNLVDNAVKYTPTGGLISIHAITRGDLVQVDVGDTGIGIETKHIPRIFERFYRVDKARSRDLGGTGLGLAIVKHIIQYHGGEVWVASTPGKGSTFSFTLQTVAGDSD